MCRRQVTLTTSLSPDLLNKSHVNGVNEGRMSPDKFKEDECGGLKMTLLQVPSMRRNKKQHNKKNYRVNNDDDDDRKRGHNLVSDDDPWHKCSSSSSTSHLKGKFSQSTLFFTYAITLSVCHSHAHTHTRIYAIYVIEL